MPKELYRVYVDETGDRGWGGRASPTFVVSAVIVKESERLEALATLDQLNVDLGKPPKTVLHWADNVKTHAARKHVARVLGRMPIVVTSVLVIKPSMMGQGSALNDPTSMYNYAVRRLLERVSWYVDDHNGEAIITFAHVKRFPYRRLESYLALLQSYGSSVQIRWHAFRGKPRIEQPNRVRLLQLADLAAGCIGSALRLDEFGDHEIAYLRELIPVIYLRGNARVSSYGMNIVGTNDCMHAYPWWNHFVEACSRR